MNLLIDTIESAIGRVFVVSDGACLCAVDYEGFEPRMHALLRAHYGAFTLVPASDPNGFSTRLAAYFNSEIAAIDDIAIAPGGTTFQQRVWAALRQIPAGSTTTYGQLAARLGLSSAARAVGAANARNPVSIVVPCHRLIGANGQLTGYAGGLPRKQWLLEHERAHARAQQPQAETPD
jgi:methylated-DNA-[protein]-cysteine S-methyltransferase